METEATLRGAGIDVGPLVAVACCSEGIVDTGLAEALPLCTLPCRWALPRASTPAEALFAFPSGCSVQTLSVVTAGVTDTKGAADAGAAGATGVADAVVDGGSGAGLC